MLKYFGMKCHYVPKVLSNGLESEKNVQYVNNHRRRIYRCWLLLYFQNSSLELKIFKYKNERNLLTPIE